MTTQPPISHKLTPRSYRHTTTYKTSSDNSSHPDTSSTPAFTPAETPPQNANSHASDLPDLSHLDSRNMEETKAEEPGAKAEAQPTSTQDSSPQSELKPKDAGENKIKKAKCKKHPKGHKSSKRSKPKEESSSESESSSSSSSSSSESSSTESEESETSSSSSEEDTEVARKRKIKAKKARKLRERRKARSKKHKESTEEESDEESSDESETEEEVIKKKKSKSRKKRRSKKSRKEEEELESEDADESDVDLARAKAQLKSLGIRRRGGKGARGGRAQVDDETLKKALKGKSKDKGKKKKRSVLNSVARSVLKRLMLCRGSKVDFVRVDQLWDSSIHNYKLTETAEDADAGEYDQYVFTVRRKFDWENKYTDTVVDIKSKPLKEVLIHVMGAVKGVSFAEETPIIDPNMLFLYLEELRTHMKELKVQSKSEKKKKIRKAAAVKQSHAKVLIKYLDKDYAETKKTLYPLLESNTITFDLLWALYKSNEIAYCSTYSNADEPRAFKIEYATKVRTGMSPGIAHS